MSKKQLFYRVRSVLLSDGGSALTLSPVEWGRESTTEFEELDGEQVGVWGPCDPTDDRAEALELGGKMTELRFEGDSPWKPGAMLRVTVDWAGAAK